MKETYSIKTIKRRKVSNRGKAQFLGLDGQVLFVEQAALEDYEKQGYCGLWSANEFWWEIMTLLFWDVIYVPIKESVSFSESGSLQRNYYEPNDPRFEKLFYQMIQLNGMPTDFYTPEFYKRREQLFSERIKELDGASLIDVLEDSFNNHHGLNCRPIEKWDRFTLDQLKFGINSIEKKRLIKFLHYLIEDFTYRRKGLPDLFLYNEKGPIFVEVKAKDKLSVEQENWLGYIKNELGIRTEVCVINEIGWVDNSSQDKNPNEDHFIDYLNEVENLIKDKKLGMALNKANDYLQILHDEEDESWFMMYYQMAVIHAKEKRWEDALLNMGFVIYYLGKPGGVGHEQLIRRLLKKFEKEDQYNSFVHFFQTNDPETIRTDIGKMLK